MDKGFTYRIVREGHQLYVGLWLRRVKADPSGVSTISSQSVAVNAGVPEASATRRALGRVAMTFVVSHGTGCWELCVLMTTGILGIIVLDALRAFWEMWSPMHTELAL